MSFRLVQFVSNKLRTTFQDTGWKENVLNLSEQIFRKYAGTSSQTEDSYVASVPEQNLPKLPVPDLDHTLTRYLEALRPILSKTQYLHSEMLVKRFGEKGGAGDILQQVLFKKQEISDNWAYDWWLDDMYLANQLALPINSNPGMVLPPRKITSLATNTIEMAQFGARIITSAFEFKQKLDGKQLPVETARYNNEENELCMRQYYRLFTSYRRPGILKDTLVKTETEFTKTRPYVIILCADQLYAVHLTKGENAELLKEEEIVSQLIHILENSIVESSQSLPVGILTGLKRDVWATMREQLSIDEQNRKNLSTIERSMLIVCFDMKGLSSRFNSSQCTDNSEYHVGSRDETNMAHQMIHGGGKSANSGNRWFDKTIQMIIGVDGVNGLCYEHSPAEGVAVINVVEQLIDSCKNLTIQESEKYDTTAQGILPEKLVWYLSDDMKHQIYNALDLIDRNVKELDFCVYRFNDYGKEFIKSCRTSPDAYIQLALQLTYFRMYGKLCATYESASTRRFLSGRVDCIRAATPEALNWVSAMQSSGLDQSSKSVNYNGGEPMEKKLELLRIAIQKQTEITMENIMGQGIDVHLLGLRQAAKEASLKVDIFDDEAFTIANRFLLSTSQVATKSNGFMGYGPVVPDGYGASYNPKPDSITFCISSFKTNETTSTDRFIQFLSESLRLMKAIYLYER